MSALALQNAPNPSTAHFLHLTDLHFWRVVTNPFQLLNKRFIGNLNVVLRRRHEFLTNQAPAFLDYIGGLGVRDVGITGDFTSTSTEEEFAQARDFVRRLVDRGMQPTVIAGNHDVYTFESVRHDRFKKYLGAWAPKDVARNIGLLSNGAPVVYIPTVCPNLLSSKGRITPAELEDARKTLTTFRGPLVIAGHYPALDKTYGYATKPNRRLRQAEKLATVLREYRDPALYISGHVHRFSFVRDPIQPSLRHLTSGALFRHDHVAGHTGDFSEVRLTPTGFKIHRHVLHEKWSVSEETERPG